MSKTLYFLSKIIKNNETLIEAFYSKLNLLFKGIAFPSSMYSDKILFIY